MFCLELVGPTYYIKCPKFSDAIPTAMFNKSKKYQGLVETNRLT